MDAWWRRSALRMIHDDEGDDPMTDTTDRPLIEVPPSGGCECGDPRCVYVANLATAVELLEDAAARLRAGREADHV